MPERQFRVQGKVQGVGFRWWTRSLAQRLGVTGTVRNLPDGSVEVRANGSEEALARLREELETGPSGAEVSLIEEQPTSDVPTDRFDIAR
jgi:acylphosphatase